MPCHADATNQWIPEDPAVVAVTTVLAAAGVKGRGT